MPLVGVLIGDLVHDPLKSLRTWLARLRKRADAQSRGRWSYFRFAIRELAGLLHSPSSLIPKTRWTLVVGGGLAGLVLGAAASYVLPASYTSEAALMLAPSSIPDGLLTNLNAFELDTAGLTGRGLDLLRQRVTSRSHLEKIIGDYDLYPRVRTRKPLDAIAADMRKDVHIERTGDFTIRVAFTYWGSFGAHRTVQRVTQELVSQLLDQAIQEESNRLFQSEAFFAERSEDAAKKWDQLNSQNRALTTVYPYAEHVALDRELARKEYEFLRQRLAEVRLARDLSERQEGRKLLILDATSLPEEPDTPATEMSFYGLGCGLALGLIAALWSSLRRTSRSVPFIAQLNSPAIE